MNAQRTIPNPSRQDVATFDILSGGRVVNPGYQVISIVVTKEVNRIPTAKIVIRDGDAAEETFEISNKDEFIPGKEIQIKIGRDNHNNTVFQGIITKHSIRVRENGQSDLLIECRDKSVKMTLGRHSKYFENQTDSQVAETIIGNYSGLVPDVESTSLRHKELVQTHVTDWDFILSRADANGKLVMVDDGTLSVKAPDTSQNATLSLLYGATILEFEAEMDARTQWNSVEGKAWDYTNQRLFQVTTQSASFSEGGNISGASLAEAFAPDHYELQHSGQVLEEELQQWTNASMLKSRLAKIRGRAKIREGYVAIKPGHLVDLQGIGNRFNGKAFVSAVRQEMSNGVWDTHIQFGLAPEWFAGTEKINDFPAAGLVPGIKGLQVGIVVQIQDDPDGEDRIRIKLPVLDNQSQGIWARIASLDAGLNRGTFFRPEIDDEVIVGFINDDPRDAIVLGMMHSSAKPAPINPRDSNHEKGIITRDGLRIFFDDSTKTISIDTPAGNSIVLDEAGSSIKLTDQNSNTISLGPTGIDLESPKNINISAGAAITLAATTSLSIGGASMSAKADGPISLEGATAKLSSPGITELSGSLVKIN